MKTVIQPGREIDSFTWSAGDHEWICQLFSRLHLNATVSTQLLSLKAIIGVTDSRILNIQQTPADPESNITINPRFQPPAPPTLRGCSNPVHGLGCQYFMLVRIKRQGKVIQNPEKKANDSAKDKERGKK